MNEKLPTYPTPAADNLRALLTRREGSLSEVSFASLLLALAVEERSALLELRRGPLYKKVYLEGGSPVDCESNIATETLGRYLVSVGKVSETDYPMFLSVAASRGMALEDVLQERQILSPSELYRLLQQNLGRKLLDAFNWRTGTYRISSDVPPTDSTLRVKVPQLLFTGLTKFESQDSIDEAVSGLGAMQIKLADEPLFAQEEIRFNAEQVAVVEGVRRGLALEDLVKTTGVHPDDVARIAWALLFMGIASPIERAVAAPSFEQAPAAAAPVAETITPPKPAFMLELEQEPDAPSVPATLSRDDTATAITAPPAPPVPFMGKRKTSREEIMRTFLSFKKKDPFELLDVSEDSSASTIVRAYLSFSETFAPSQFDEKDADGIRDKAQQIFLAGARAYADLVDENRRNVMLERRRKAKDDVLKREAVAAAAAAAAKARREPEPEPSGLIDPEALYREGRQLADAGKLREALSHFEMAADCDAQNGTYAAELAYCRFQLLITPANNALRSLKDVMRIDPNCGAAYLFTGKVHAALGNKLEAEGYLRRAAGMMPRDRRPHEALRALAS